MSRIARLLAALAVVAGLAAPARAQTPSLRVGSTATGIPFTFLDTRTNTIQGMMVDIIQAIGRDQGFTVEVVATPFGALIPSLTSNRIDIISAAMLITPARQEVVDFSQPIYRYGEGLVVPAADTREYRTLEDLRGRTAGAQAGTVYIEPLRSAGVFSEVRVYDSLADIMRDVNVGRLNAGFGDRPILAYQIAQGAFPGVRLVPSYQSTVVGSIGLAVRKGDPLLARLNAGIDKLRERGGIDEIVRRWNLQ